MSINNIKNITIGNKPIKAVYRGGDLVYEKKAYIIKDGVLQSGYSITYSDPKASTSYPFIGTVAHTTEANTFKIYSNQFGKGYSGTYNQSVMNINISGIPVNCNGKILYCELAEGIQMYVKATKVYASGAVWIGVFGDLMAQTGVNPLFKCGRSASDRFSTCYVYIYSSNYTSQGTAITYRTNYVLPIYNGTINAHCTNDIIELGEITSTTFSRGLLCYKFDFSNNTGKWDWYIKIKNMFIL